MADPKEMIRVVRVLEYIGPREWVEETLDRSLLQLGRVELGRDSSIQELTRATEVMNG